mgnify:CR=1 FL=1
MVCAAMVDLEGDVKPEPGGDPPSAETGSPPSAGPGDLNMKPPDLETEPADFLWISGSLYLVIAVFGVILVKS